MKKYLLLILVCLVGCTSRGSKCSSSKECFIIAEKTITVNRAIYRMSKAIYFAIQENKGVDL